MLQVSCQKVLKAKKKEILQDKSAVNVAYPRNSDSGKEKQKYFQCAGIYNLYIPAHGENNLRYEI